MHRSARIAVIAAPLLIATTLAGCSTGASAPTTTSSSSASATADAAKTTAPTVTLGDAVGEVKDGEPVIITDEWGSYQKMVVNPDAAMTKTIASDDDGSATENGFTDAEILDGQQWLAAFIVSEGIDSTILDNVAGKAAWVQAHRDVLEGDVLSLASGQTDGLAIVNTQQASDAIALKYARDGKPRASDVTVKLNQVRGVAQNGEAYLVFDGTYDVDYRAKSADVYAAYDAKGYTKQQVEDTLPAIKSDDELPVKGTATFQYALHRVGDTWRIAGFTFDYNNNLA